MAELQEQLDRATAAQQESQVELEQLVQSRELQASSAAALALRMGALLGTAPDASVEDLVAALQEVLGQNKAVNGQLAQQAIDMEQLEGKLVGAQGRVLELSEENAALVGEATSKAGECEEHKTALATQAETLEQARARIAALEGEQDAITLRAVTTAEELRNAQQQVIPALVERLCSTHLLRGADSGAVERVGGAAARAQPPRASAATTTATATR